MARPLGSTRVRDGLRRLRLWVMRRRRWLAAAAVVALVIAFVIPILPSDPDPAPAPDAQAAEPAPCTNPTGVMVVAASADKSALLAEVAEDYGPRLVAGRCLGVEVDEYNSGDAMEALVRGWPESAGRRPEVWSPASTEWLTLAGRRAGDAADRFLPEEAPQSIVRSPLVIAMPEPMAQALGWPERDVGWRQLAELATDPDGWAAYGHPEWGPFRIGKTNPKYSTSGLNATIAAFSAHRPQSGGRPIDEPLTTGDVDDAAAQEFVRRIELSMVHYGQTSLHFLENLRRADDERRALSYISAVTIEESSVLAYNVG